MDVEIAVIGGGPAGATAARLLSGSNMETVLVERNLNNEKPCGGGLLSTAFTKFGIPQHLIKNKVHSIRVISPGGNSHDISLNGAYLGIVHRKEFDAALRKAAVDEGTEVMEGTLLSIRSSGKFSMLTIKAAAGEIQLKARHTIAADGVNSTVVRSIFGRFPRRVYTAHEIHGTAGGNALKHCEFRFGAVTPPGFYSWIFPHKDGISIGTGSEHTAEVDTYLDTLVRSQGLSPNGQRRGYFIPVWDGTLYYNKGVYFVGDAAGMVLPFTYEGIYYAMRSAEFAAEAVLKDNPALYKKLWQETYRRRYLLMRTLQRYFLKNETRMERLVSLYGHPHIREASMCLWTQDDAKVNIAGGIASLIKKYGTAR